MGQGKLRWTVTAVIAAGLLTFQPRLSTSLAQQNAAGQLVQFGFDGASEDEVSGVFLPTERTAKRRLDQARTLITEERYGESVRMLDMILEDHEDSFFQPDGDDTNYRSLKSEARRILGELPDAGREAYQLQFGVRAQKLLSEAAQQGDIPGIAEVARRFFHTDAGYEATLLLGQHHLDHNRPLAAALAFQQLVDVPRARAKFDPTVSVLAATAWGRAGMLDKAQQSLAQLKQRMPQAKLRVAGREVVLFARETEAIAWLEQNVGQLPTQSVATRADEWTMFRGSGGRNAESEGGRPLLSHRWRVRAANDPTIEKLIEQMRQSYVRQEIAALPAMHPLAVDDVVLMRTAQHLLAVDFKTGKRIWEVKPRQDDSFERLIKSSRNQTELNQMPQLALGLEQRMWDDAAYGTLSSDGERVFVLQDLELLVGPLSQNIQMLAAGGAIVGGRRMPLAGPKTFNRLAAFDLETEGKLLWEVGGPDGESEQLADAFFLGPPLPLSGNLYVLAEIKGGIRLVVLDAKTGQLQWTQQLADLERNILQDPFRRLAGATPSFTDGVLVCPTSAGVVVAVDLSTRSLLWAHKYPAKSSRQRTQMAMMMMRGYAASQLRSNESWLDASVTIVDGRVLLTPIESDQIYCLNLLDGTALWQHEREDGLYVACVHNDNVIVVGVNEVKALRLADGQPAWEAAALELPEGSLPSGRGYYSGQHYYLPLSSAEVVKIDLETGEIVERAHSRDGHVPGNLICYQGEIISQGPDYLEVFYQFEALHERVQLALKANPNDPEALAHLGELQFDAGDLADSIDSLRRSFALAPNDLTRELLIRSLLEGLRVDFAAHRPALEELDELIDQPDQRAELVRLTAIGLQQAGETLSAFEHYLQLVDLAENEDQLEKIDETHSVRRSRWVQAQLSTLYEAGTDAERAEMDTAIAARRQQLAEHATAGALRQFLQHFGDFPIADQVRKQLVAQLLTEAGSLECELLIRQLAQSPSAEMRRAAVPLMARLLTKTSRLDAAAPFYQQLATELADQVCLDGKTGQQLLEELSPADAAEHLAQHTWPHGKVIAQTTNPKSNTRTHRRMFPLDLRDSLGPFYHNMTVSFDQQGQTLVGQDGYGATQFQIPLNQPNTARRSYVVNPSLNYGKTYGHLLIVSMGYQILAVDTLNTKQANWQNVLWKQDLTEQVAGMAMHQRVQIKRINLPGGESRFQAEDDQGRPIGTLGPVIPQGITFQRFRSLMAVDPLTGETLWMREDIPAGSDLFGDEKQLIVVPPGSDEAIVLRPLDGSKLGTCPVPPISQRLATIGAQILKLEYDGGPVLTLVDPWARQEVWSREFAVGSKFTRVDHETLGVMQRDGKFVLLSLADGVALIDDELEPEPQLLDIYVQPSQAHYVLLTNRPAPESRGGISITPAPGGLNNPLVTGNVYVFDRATGKRRWSVPASVEQHGLMLPQPSELPVLVFVRHIINPNESGRQRTKTSVLCLDKRTGQAVYEKDDFAFGTGFFNMAGDKATNTVSLTLPSITVNLQYTDTPVPPEPPRQAGLKAPRRNSGSLRVLGSLFKALGRAASEVQGGSLPQIDPFDDGFELEEPTE